MADEAPAKASPEAARLETPSRERLLARYAKTESFAKSILFAEIAVGILVLVWIAVRVPRPFGWLPWVAFAVGGLGVFRWFLHHLFLNKKRIEEIPPDAHFGDHTRDSLVELCRETFARLGLRRGAVPVFLIRAKDINAQALRCELWPGLHLFNGVYLNRSTIHLLDARELASVIGHELGHVIPYSPLLARCYVVHSLLAGLVSFALAATFPHPGVALIAPLAVLWVLDWVVALPHLGWSRGIEFLCDDFGARAAGLLPALSSELKFAIEQEMRQRLLLRVLTARKSGSGVALSELVEAYEEAIPFGRADTESFERELRNSTSKQQQSEGSISLGGFLRHLQGTGNGAREDEWVEEQIGVSAALDSLPIVPLDRAAYLVGSQGWSHRMAEDLTAAIVAHPGCLLVRLPLELDDSGATHPSAARRILFLWRNRAAYPGHGG